MTSLQNLIKISDLREKTPSSWAEETRGRRSSGGHKRSASWGSAEHLREVAKLRHQLQKRSRHAPPTAGYELSQPPLAARHAAAEITSGWLTDGYSQSPDLPPPQTVPLNRLAPRLRRSVEGLNLELEEVFVSEKSGDQHEVRRPPILDIPDGHRAPVPVQRCSSGSQSEPSPGPLDSFLLSPSHSPCAINPSCFTPAQSPRPTGEPAEHEAQGPTSSLPSFPTEPSLFQPCSSSPRPNKTCSFLRQPPEGCERVRACEEAP
uniref:Family with sequence similarity 117 member Aa n=1 Tax=Takifugu rubripes TaxID=31033 RepID=H2TWD3_TAKRU